MFRRWLNILTACIVVLMLWALRDDLVRAWDLLATVNIWLLLLIIPLQFLSYFANGEAIFSYLKQRGQMKNVNAWDMTRMSLELNFVNHILPTAGVSGASYMTWRLNKLGISSGRATLGQVVRFAAVFGSYVVLLVLAVFYVTFDTGVNRLIILMSSALVSAIIILGMVVWYVLDSEARMKRFAYRVARAVNWAGRKVMRRKAALLSPEKVHAFFDDLQDDYWALKKQPRMLVKPFLWGVVFNLTEVSLFFFTFLALGTFVNPAAILLAMGIAAMVGAFLVTPGGAGGYEAVMVFVLTTAGVKGAIVLAGVILARVILILLTIVSGYIFYHLALKKYGKHPAA
jgi:uncharacterized protein (TIRG00374 family)